MSDADKCGVCSRLAMRLLVLALAIIATATTAQAQPHKEQYDLQERCGRRAEQVFKSDNPGQSGGSIVSNTDDGGL
jgi:hypothetical protein